MGNARIRNGAAARSKYRFRLGEIIYELPLTLYPSPTLIVSAGCLRFYPTTTQLRPDFFA